MLETAIDMIRALMVNHMVLSKLSSSMVWQVEK